MGHHASLHMYRQQNRIWTGIKPGFSCNLLVPGPGILQKLKHACVKQSVLPEGKSAIVSISIISNSWELCALYSPSSPILSPAQ